MVFVVLLSILQWAAHAEATKSDTRTITWIFTSPSNLNSDVKTNIVDENHPLFRLYRQNLSDYQHTMIRATIPRIEVELKSKDLVCYPGSSEAKRRKGFSYLTPQYIQPAPELITSKSIVEKYFKENHEGVSLKELLKDKRLRGLVGSGRSFGPEIDELISASSPGMRSGVYDSFGPSLMQMIEKGRADYTVEYPFILEYLQKNNGISTNLVAIPFSDVNHSVTQYLACSKTADGLTIVKRADQTIRENVRKPEYWKGVIESMPEKSRRPFQKEIEKFIEYRAKKSIVIE
jgi:uncharacterized protein (TIGR02285 family)